MTDQQTCPLCDVTGEGARAIYTHLMVHHRKSEISKALLTSTDASEPPSQLH